MLLTASNFPKSQSLELNFPTLCPLPQAGFFMEGEKPQQKKCCYVQGKGYGKQVILPTLASS